MNLDSTASATSAQVAATSGRTDTDFGGFPYGAPARVVAPTRGDELVAALKIAAKDGQHLGIRGAGHCCHGQTACPDGTLVRNFVREAQWESIDDERIRVSTRSSWLELERALNRVGRAAPVVTDYLDLSVGGTLAVGGFGVDSFGRGAQTDHVTEVELVALDGTSHRINRDADPQLFRFSLAARGQLGFLESVVMRTVEHRPYTLRQRFLYPNLHRLLDVVEEIAAAGGPTPGRFHGGVIHPGIVFAEVGEAHKTAAAAKLLPRPHYLRRLGSPANEALIADIRFADHQQIRGWVNSYGPCHRMWVDYLLPVDRVRGFVGEVEAMRKAGEFGEALKCVYLGVVAPQQRPGFAFDARGPVGGGRRIGVGLYAMVTKDDRAAADRVDRAYRHCLERCLDLGGRPYLYGWVALDEELAQRCYGHDVATLERLRTRFDPQRRLVTGRWRR